MNRRIIGILALSATLAFCGGLAACDNNVESIEPEVTLIDFQDEESTVLLDGSYALPSSTVRDENGVEYAVEYSVVTESGKTVKPIGNVVWIKNYETYYVYCSVNAGDGQTIARTVTLKVEDEGAPEITFGDSLHGYAGESCLLPSVTVLDSSGVVAETSVKVYALKNGEKGEEIATDSVSFFAETEGYYAVEATAKDCSGNEARKTEVVRILPQSSKNTILSFENPSDASKISYKSTGSTSESTTTWLPEFAGQKNVVQIKFSDKYKQKRLAFEPTCAESYEKLVERYDYVILRAYVVQTEEYTNSWYSLKFSGASGGTRAQYNKWVDYKIPVARFTDTNLITEGNSAGGDSTVLTEGMVYVAGLYFVNEASVEATAPEDTTGFAISAKDGSGTALDLSKATVRVVAPNGVSYLVSDNYFVPETAGTYVVYVQIGEYWGATTFEYVGAETE